jgi:serine/threonine protein phosphatase PrpC
MLKYSGIFFEAERGSRVPSRGAWTEDRKGQGVALFETAMVTGVGGRPTQEDRADFCLAEEAGCWVIADGLGGHRGGEVASNAAVEAMLATFRRQPACRLDLLRRTFVAAEREILERQARDPSRHGMRTTAIVLLADATCALWGHIGDTRLYHFLDGRIAAQTRDHSILQVLVTAGQVRPEDVRGNENRNLLTRVLGQGKTGRPTFLGEAVAAHPDEAFLLCSDGFWEHVTEAEMELDWSAAEGRPALWLSIMEERIIAHATLAQDNYTALAVRRNG